jgi:hypothetical protein
MATREIPRQEWMSFCDEFSKLHQGATATVRVVGSDVGDQDADSGMPFVGLSFESKGSERNSIAIELGADPEDHTTHWVERPAHLWLRSGDADAAGEVKIETDDGTSIIVELAETPELPR